AAAVLGQYKVTADTDRRLLQPAGRAPEQDVGEVQAQVGALDAAHLLDAVSLLDVTDLVRKHTGQLAHVVRRLDQAAVHVDVATRHGEGVDLLRVHDVEPVRDPAVTRRGDLSAEVVDVRVDLRIIDDGQLRIDLRGVVGAQLLLLLRRDGRTAGKRRGPGSKAERDRMTEAPEHSHLHVSSSLETSVASRVTGARGVPGACLR